MADVTDFLIFSSMSCITQSLQHMILNIQGLLPFIWIKKRDQVQLCLNKIINGNIMIPRSELMFFVIEAVDASDRELAQRFIDCSKEWYPQSRVVTSAQNYLDP